jgi:phage shock protein E
MKRCDRVVLTPSMLSPLWAASLLWAFSGCSSSTSNTIDTGETGAPNADSAAPGLALDGKSLLPDTAAADTPPARVDGSALDTAPAPADAVALDTPSLREDAERPQVRADGGAPEVATVQPDALARDAGSFSVDLAPPVDTSPRLDAVVRETAAGGSEVALSSCTLDSGAATFVHLSPLELKTLLASSENPYLINVKGTSIANIPGTDAVLASDVPSIEALVGGNLCANIVLYCRSGATSQTVGNQLIAKGYLRVRDLAGGILAWESAGYPTE